MSINKDDSQWVHEDGYGSPAVGGIIHGLWDIAVGLVLLVRWIVTGK